MKILRNLPEGMVLEAAEMMSPEAERNSVWNRVWKSLRSAIVKKHIEDYKKKGPRPIILVGCDIKTFNATIISSGYERRS